MVPKRKKSAMYAAMIIITAVSYTHLSNHHAPYDQGYTRATMA